MSNCFWTKCSVNVISDRYSTNFDSLLIEETFIHHCKMVWYYLYEKRIEIKHSSIQESHLHVNSTLVDEPQDLNVILDCLSIHLSSVNTCK